MAGLLYYVPKLKHATLAHLADLGLAYAFEKDCTPRGCRGPDGGDGVILADSSRVPDIGYYKERQMWLKIPGNSAGAWVGRDKQPVLPADLQRAEILRGHPVMLGDGQEWHVPIARGWAHDQNNLVWYEALPLKSTIDIHGKWCEGEVVDRYAAIWEVATRWWDQFWAATPEQSGDGDDSRTNPAETTIEFDFAGLRDAALVVLSANYRIQAAEVALLGLFETGTAQDILQAAIDFPTYLKELKKKEGQEAPAAGD